MIEFWKQRNNREKILIGVAAALLAFLVLWQFLFKPISNYPAAQERAYKQAELDLKIMQKGQRIIKAQANTSATSTTKLSVEQFQSTITKSTKTHGLVITRRQPKGLTELSLWLDSVDSKAFYTWVDALTSGYNITLDKAQIYRNDDNTVRVLVTFKLAEKS